ncbi:MAG: phosphoribosyl-AMP cyclohydrolase [Limnochordia bacterium]|jgi:phosphoribosyl-AMP cyclohydrolase|nr:phosphoribosyl-AMP cyclohydrolase [Limnochordia bacterium]MDD2628984.1 phosphoribosyl-AMP cyclohydrolase [Limnochordia bacterium]MDD4518348.1 phosphoribosyl-AMP cyclohydrolase [Limnochordia bacterium]
MNIEDLKFKDDLIPAIIQDYQNGEILMLAYMNPESVKRTLETKRTWFWSRSRQKYWMKGESSGHVQIVKEVITDCDQDTLLIKVEQVGPGACHTGHRSCFHHPLGEGTPDTIGEVTFDVNAVYGKENVLEKLYENIKEGDLEKINTRLLDVAGKIVAGEDSPKDLICHSSELLLGLLSLLKARQISVDELLVELNTRDL